MADPIVEGFKKLSTAAVADVFRYIGYPMQVMDPTILPFKDGWKVCGRAFTQNNLPARKREPDTSITREALSKWGPGDVIVESYWGAWGLNYARGANAKGCAGAIIDGPYRDIPGHLQELPDLPVFCRRGLPDRSANPGGSHRGSYTRFMYAYNVPINCGGVRVDPGDIIVGDADGVVVVPKEIKGTVLKFAQTYEEADDAQGLARKGTITNQEAEGKKVAWEKSVEEWLAQHK